MSLSGRNRHVINTQQDMKYSTRQMNINESLKCNREYYPKKKVTKHKKNKSKNLINSKEKKIRSADEHGQSLRKFQTAIENRNKNIVKLMKEKSQLKAQNELLRIKLLKPENHKQQEYFISLNKLTQQLQKAKSQELNMEKKYKAKILKLQKQKGKKDYELKQLKKKGRK